MVSCTEEKSTDFVSHGRGGDAMKVKFLRSYRVLLGVQWTMTAYGIRQEVTHAGWTEKTRFGRDIKRSSCTGYEDEAGTLGFRVAR